MIEENSDKDTKITSVGGVDFLTGIIILDNCTNDAYFAYCRTNHMPITGGEWKFEPSNGQIILIMEIKIEKCIGPKEVFKSWVGPGSAHFT